MVSAARSPGQETSTETGFDDILVGIIAPDGVTLSYGSAADIGSANAVLDQYPDTLYETFFGAAVR